MSAEPLSRLPLRVIIANAGPSLALTMVAFHFYVYLPKFYTETVGISLSAMAAIILVSRLWDAVLDPALGVLSDRTHTRWGRRLPWIAVACIPLVLLDAALLMPGTWARGGAADAWVLGVLTVLFFAAWTAIAVPYEALGAELSLDYDERSRLFGFKDGAVVVGTLAAAILPALANLAGTDSGAVDPSTHRRVALLHAVTLVLAVGVMLAVVRERPARPLGTLPKLGRDAFVALRNRPFRLLLIAYTVSGLGMALPPTLGLFYIEDVLRSDNAPALLVIYLFVGVLFVPLWAWLARRLEKRSAWLLSTAINTGAFSCVLALGEGDAPLYALLIALSAIGFAGTMVIPPSMQADVIDLDELETGERREGRFVGLWSIARKVAAAAGGAMAFPILEWTGYRPGAEVQPLSALVTLSVLYAGVPCLCNMVAFVVARRYPLDRAEHHRIRAAIDARIVTAG